MALYRRIAPEAESKPRPAIAVVLGLWLVGVFAASMLGRSYLGGTGAVALLTFSVVWPIVYFALTRYRFVPDGLALDRLLALLLFVIFGAASLYVSPVPWQSLPYFVLTLAGIMIALQFNTNLRPAQYELGMKMYAVLATLLLVGFALYDYRSGTRLGNNTNLLNPNAVSLIAVSAVLASMCIRTVLVRYMTMFCAMSVLVLTGSRTSAAVAALGLTFVFLNRMKSAKTSSKVLVLMLLLLVAGVGYVSAEFFMGGVEDFLAIDDPHRGLRSGASGRAVAWQHTWEMALANPLIGVGFRAHEYVLDVATSAHNGYLSTLAEIGFIGFFGVMYLIVKGMFDLRAALKQSDLVFSHAVLYGLGLGCLLLAMFERYLINIGNPTSLLFLIAVMRPSAAKVSRIVGAEKVAPARRVANAR